MKLDAQSEVESLLEMLDGALQLEDEAEPIELLVCGGAALLAMGLVDRATEDVDVLAIVENGRDVMAKPLPGFLESAIQRVARDRRLPTDWINSRPAEMQQWGLPGGCLERASRKEYGEFLAVRYLARFDQIHLKLYAAVDQGTGKHLSDLRALEPNIEELVSAARWCVTHDPSPGFRKMLVQMLEHLGFSDAAGQI